MNEDKAAATLLGEAFLDAIRQAVREEIQVAVGRNWAGRSAEKETTRSKAMNDPRLYLTIKEAADLASIAPSTIRLYIRKRQLKSHKVGRRIIIKRLDLEKFLESDTLDGLPG